MRTTFIVESVCREGNEGREANAGFWLAGRGCIRAAEKARGRPGCAALPEDAAGGIVATIFFGDIRGERGLGGEEARPEGGRGCVVLCATDSTGARHANGSSSRRNSGGGESREVVIVVDKRDPVSLFDTLLLAELDTEDCDRILETKVDEVGLVSGDVTGIW